jgi:hypothetical protein
MPNSLRNLRAFVDNESATSYVTRAIKHSLTLGDTSETVKPVR